MAYDINDNDYEPNTPKKADVLIKSTQAIAARQEELCNQTRAAVAKIDEALAVFGKNGQDTSYLLENSYSMFDKLRRENASLKQELLYLAKQNENIYAGLADKLGELQSLGGQSRRVSGGEGGLDARLQSVAEALSAAEAKIEALAAAMAKLEALDAVSEKLNSLSEVSGKLDRLSISMAKLDALAARIDSLSAVGNDDAIHGDIVEKLDAMDAKVSALGDRVDAAAESASGRGFTRDDAAAITDKLDRIAESMRKNEGAHSMLADKFEILSMRVEQFGYESVKPQPTVYAQPAAYPAPVQTAVEIDYDKLASKVADVLAVREAVSPEYIASRVAEQLVLPEGGVSVDAHSIAAEVASFIDGKRVFADETVRAEIDEDKIAGIITEKMDGIVAAIPDGDAIAEKIAERLSVGTAEVAPVNINEDVLAEKIAERLNVVAENEITSDTVEFDDDALADKIVSRIGEVLGETAAASAGTAIDQDELSDSIALKVGSLNPEDFEIIVDDAGCASISREIAEKLDYGAISTIIADKLREILDLNMANAHDYEDMAERISEKITVAGINEDAIADKAAAVLSNYLPEFDTAEITDKVTGAVIDVVSAMPQPTLDSETLCNEITQRLIESQEDNNYDIMLDDDGISRITAIVSEEIEKSTLARFDRLEESIEKLNEMLAPEEVEDEADEVAEDGETDATEDTEAVADDIGTRVYERFDKLEDDVAKIYDIVSSIVVETEEAETTDEGEISEEAETTDDTRSFVAADYEKLSEIVASEIEKGVSARLDSVEGKLDTLSEMFTVEDEEENGEQDTQEYAEGETREDIADGEDTDEAEEIDETDENYENLSRLIGEIQTSISTRFDTVEGKIDNLSEMFLSDEEEFEQPDDASADEVEESVEVDETDAYDALTRLLSDRFDKVEGDIARVYDAVTGLAVETEEYVADGGEALSVEAADYTKLSEIVANEIDRSVGARFDSIDGDIARIMTAVGTLAAAGAVAGGTDAESALCVQLEKISEDLRRVTEYIGGEIPVIATERVDKISADIEKLSRLVEGEFTVETYSRLDRVSEELEKLNAAVRSGELTAVAARTDGDRLERVEGSLDAIKDMLSGAAAEEEAAAYPAEAEEEQELVTVSDLVKPVPDDDDGDGDDDGDDFLLNAIDMDKFLDDESMPGELDLEGGVDFENMMKYNRSFIARIIQSDDDTKRYYGAVKQALLSYKKVNSNVAWSNERFNKGRETVARMKIRGKTLVIYLALDPNEYKTSVYHHTDVSDNKTVLGTPMMIKVKSPLGVKKAVRLIDEMLSKRGGEKRDVPERDYAAMYPYEAIAELIEDGLVKDVRKK